MQMFKSILVFISILISNNIFSQTTCNDRISANEGQNYVPQTDQDYYWYKYTMPIDGKLTIESESLYFFAVFTGECNSWNVINGGHSQLGVYTNFKAGDNIGIRYRTNNKGDFFWNLTVTPFESGDNCASAALGQIGINTIPPINGNDYFYYQITMPEDGKLLMESNVGVHTKIFTNDCNTLDYSDGLLYYWKTAQLTKYAPGTEIFVAFELGFNEEINWTLDIVPFELGDRCDYVKNASLGNNFIESNNSSYHYYKFIMPSQGKLKLKRFGNSENYSTTVSIYKNNMCDESNLVFYGDYEIELPSLETDETVYIKFLNQQQIDFNWNLSIEPYEEGDICEMAKKATIGNNWVPNNNNECWYQYIMPENKAIKIKDALKVKGYTTSCDTIMALKASNEHLITTPKAGETVFFYLVSPFQIEGNGSFNISIFEIPFENGDKCEIPGLAVVGINRFSKNVQWTEFTTHESGEYIIESKDTKINGLNLQIFSS